MTTARTLIAGCATIIGVSAGLSGSDGAMLAAAAILGLAIVSDPDVWPARWLRSEITDEPEDER